MDPNNAYIGFCTRTFLSKGALLCGDVFDSVEAVLEHTRVNSPGGLVYTLALREGASMEHAEKAGVAAELWYAACSLTDDIQDGDAGYAGTLAEQVNVQSMLICLSFLCLGELGVREQFALRGIRMLSGQHMEISTGKWGIAEYDQVGRAIAGEAFGLYMFLVAVAARGWDGVGSEYCEQWRAYGQAFGLVLHVAADSETSDKRWFSIPAETRNQYAMRAVRDLKRAAVDVVSAHETTEALLRRIKCVDFGADYGGDT